MTPKTLVNKIKKQKLVHGLNKVFFKVIAIFPILILAVDHFLLKNYLLSNLESEYSRNTMTLAFSIMISLTVILSSFALIYFRKISYEIVLHKLQKQLETLSSNASSTQKSRELEDDRINFSIEDSSYFLKLSNIYLKTTCNESPHKRLLFLVQILIFPVGCIFYGLTSAVLNDTHNVHDYTLPLIIHLVSITQIILSIFNFSQLILTKGEKELFALNALCRLKEDQL